MSTTIQVRVVHAGTGELPAYETLDSAGMDLRAHLQESLELLAGERALIPTGLKIEIPRGFEGQVRPRSGLALKRGLTVLNAPGTIDADYRGDVGVILVNLSNEMQTVDPGERVAQLVLDPVTRCEWQSVDELGDTQRGEGGFGSTGRS